MAEGDGYECRMADSNSDFDSDRADRPESGQLTSCIRTSIRSTEHHVYHMSEGACYEA